MEKKLEAKVKDTYNMGSITAFSGHEYVRAEWRPVPAGFEPAALSHPLLDVREAAGAEIQVTAKDYLANTLGSADIKVIVAGQEVPGADAVTTETPEEVEPFDLEHPDEPKTSRKRTRKSSKKEE